MNITQWFANLRAVFSFMRTLNPGTAPTVKAFTGQTLNQLTPTVPLQQQLAAFINAHGIGVVTPGAFSDLTQTFGSFFNGVIPVPATTLLLMGFFSIALRYQPLHMPPAEFAQLAMGQAFGPPPIASNPALLDLHRAMLQSIPDPQFYDPIGSTISNPGRTVAQVIENIAGV